MIPDRALVRLASLWATLATLAAAGSASANPLWATRHDGGAGSRDFGRRVRVAPSLDVYVGGTLAADSEDADMVVLRYSPAGALLWERRYDGPASGEERFASMALDGAANVFVAGSSRGSDGSLDIVTLKYSATGALMWERRWAGSAAEDDESESIFVNGIGNVVVVGSSCDTSCGVRVLEYDLLGNLVWQASFAASADTQIAAIGADIDAAGNIFVAGYSIADTSDADALVIKLTPTGQVSWWRTYDGPGGSVDWATAIEASGDGGAIVTGFSAGAGTSGDIVTVRYDAAGTIAWLRRYDGPASLWDGAAALTLDAAGGAYVAGTVTALDGSFNGVLLKYSSTGTLLWERFLQDAVGGHNELSALALDGGTGVLVAGLDQQSVDADLVVLRFGVTGDLQSHWSYDGPANGGDGAVWVARDAAGSVYVTGGSIGDDGLEDFVTVKWDSAAAIVAVEGGVPLPRSFRLGAASPTPAQHLVRFGMELPRQALVSVRLFDVQGRSTMGARASAYEAGRHVLGLSLEGLSPGLYFMRLEAQSDVATWKALRRVVVTR